MKRFGLLSAFGALVFAASVSTASAQNYVASAETFVGTAIECGGPAGRKIVTSTWLNGMGLPDNGTAHPAAAAKDIHSGLLMSKHGPTSNCSAAYADILGWTPGAPLNTLGFDVRKGGACGAGAPRINVYSGANTYFFGCVYGNATAAPQDPANWDRITFNALGAPVGGYPGAEAFIFGVTPVDAIQIIFDEGTDTVTLPDNPAGIGLTVLDNIRINNTFITKKKGNPILP